MIYRLSTFQDISSKQIKQLTLLKTIERRAAFICEDNVVCLVKIWGEFNPDKILQKIDCDYIGEQRFQEVAIVLENLNSLVEFDINQYSSIDIEYNGIILVSIVNAAVNENGTTLSIDINEWCRQFYHAMKPTFYERWNKASIGFILGFGFAMCCNFIVNK